MQMHPLNVLNRLTSAQAAANRAALNRFSLDWQGNRALFQSQAISLADGWLQTTCDSCGVTPIRFRVVNDLEACELFQVKAFISGMVHPNDEGARVDTYDAECKPCRVGMEHFMQEILMADQSCFAELDFEELP